MIQRISPPLFSLRPPSWASTLPLTVLLLLSSCTWLSSADLDQRLSKKDPRDTSGIPDTEAPDDTADTADTSDTRDTQDTEDTHVPEDLDGDGVSAEDGDCWDDPTAVPPEYQVVSSDYSDAYGVPLDWLQPTADQVHPGARDPWYDGVDQDCAGDDDFDQDLDLHRSSLYPDASGVYGSDCDDLRDDISPSSTEIPADSVDQDCDGGDTCYQDLDGDAYGSAVLVASPDLSCDQSGESSNTDDCLDSDSSVSPAAAEWEPTAGCHRDADGDGYGDAHASAGVDAGSDCDDTSALIAPTATETVADGVDQDCDGGDLCITDLDLDIWGAASTTPSADLDCSDPGEASRSGDCDDTRGSVYPGATETVADGVDQDCSGGDTCYRDADADGYGSTTTLVSADLDCTDSGESRYATDCNDASSTILPGAAETVADGVDQDCDGGDTCYRDADADTFGSTLSVTSTDLDCTDTGESRYATDCLDTGAGGPYTFPGAAPLDSTTACMLDYDRDNFGSTTAPSGGSAGTDCNDSVVTIRPGATETMADGVDQDCDGGDTCYLDLDNDTFGSTTTRVSSDLDCSDSGEARVATDCLDLNANVYPGAAERESATSCMKDSDGDGYGDDRPPSGVTAGTDCVDALASLYPGAPEICDDGFRNDCDGEDATAVEECLAGDIDLSEASGALGGENASDYAGYSVRGAGDFNGDGNPDIVTGAFMNDETGTAAGIAYLVTWPFTGTDLSSAPLSWKGESMGDYAGFDVAGVGDTNADGYDDLLIGAYRNDSTATDAGAAYVLLGSATASGRNSLGSAWPRLRGESSNDYAGQRVSPAGDLNADGYDDILVGAYQNDFGGSSAGMAYLLHGPITSSSRLGYATARLYGEAATDYAGAALGDAGDTNGDGYDDILIGSYGNDYAGATAGAAYLVTGPCSGTLSLSSASARFTGEYAGDYAGFAVDGAGDTNGDGYNDVLVGAYAYDGAGSSSGLACLFLGPLSEDDTTSLSVAEARMYGENSDDQAGFGVAGAGDVNADGLGDMIIGAPREDTGGSSAGAAYLVLGPASGSWYLSSAQAMFIGEESNDQAGVISDGAGDIDGDGFDDLVTGAWIASLGGTNTGAIYLILASDWW